MANVFKVVRFRESQSFSTCPYLPGLVSPAGLAAFSPDALGSSFAGADSAAGREHDAAVESRPTLTTRTTTVLSIRRNTPRRRTNPENRIRRLCHSGRALPLSAARAFPMGGNDNYPLDREAQDAWVAIQSDMLWVRSVRAAVWLRTAPDPAPRTGSFGHSNEHARFSSCETHTASASSTQRGTDVSCPAFRRTSHLKGRCERHS